MSSPDSPPIPDDDLDALTEEVLAATGDHVIGVGYHFRGDWRPLYRREDFVERYSYDQQERMAKDTIMEGLAKRVRESAWGFGELQYTVSRYDEAVVVHVPFRETEGVVIGVEPMSPGELHGIAERCLEYRDRIP